MEITECPELVVTWKLTSSRGFNKSEFGSMRQKIKKRKMLVRSVRCVRSVSLEGHFVCLRPNPISRYVFIGRAECPVLCMDENNSFHIGAGIYPAPGMKL
jgi:hypothetical protein